MKLFLPVRAFSRLLLFSLLALLMVSCGTSRRTVAIEEGWELLDERKVNFVRDKDVVEIRTTQPFTGIQFKVEERDIRLNGLAIEFTNGDRLEPAIDETIVAGQSSRYIELAREGRSIRTIEFRYRTTGSVLKGRANVLLYGRKYDPYRQ
jgi:hypothetical protein